MNRYLARATAARKASTIEIATVTPTMIRLFLTSSQKNGSWIALPKCASVGCTENHVGVRLVTSESGLNAVEIIQKTGKTMTTKTASPTRFQPTPARRPLRRRARCTGAICV